MNSRSLSRLGICLFVVCAGLTSVLAVRAQAPLVPGSPAVSYSLSWGTVDGGGGSCAGGVNTLDGTAGQPDAGVLAGGPYTLAGGFWGPMPVHEFYLPLLRR